MAAKNKYDILRVYRSKEQAKESYDKLSSFYDFLTGPFERKYQDKALKHLDVKEGETILEIGFGTGYCLKQIAESVGKTGKAYGIDISSGMLGVTKKRLEKTGLLERVELYCGDATKLPYESNKFDAVFMSLSLEHFDTPEIPMVLKEIKRVLKTNGRLCVLSLSKENEDSKAIRIYEWSHKKFPTYIDCRPIYVEQAVKTAGFKIKYRGKEKLFGLPLEIVIGTK